MSFSPPIRRLSTTSSSSREDLINAYEAEEERIINVLSRKLEQVCAAVVCNRDPFGHTFIPQLREEKIGLENALEAESESHVNRMARELTALRLAHQQYQQQSSTSNSSVSTSPETGMGISGANSTEPSAEAMLEAMRRENEHLRNRLVDTERDYVRISRLNEVYREELIEHRRRVSDFSSANSCPIFTSLFTQLGLPVDNLIGLASPDPYSQPTHRRSSSSYSTASSSPSTSITHYLPRPSTHGVPIPRPPSQIHRPNNLGLDGNPPLSHSPSLSESPFPFSPTTNATSLTSPNTNITSPPTSLSFNSTTANTYGLLSRGLSYPSVPPPSLSSSFGSPSVPLHMPQRDASLSPIEPLSRRNSNAWRGDWRSNHRSGEASRRGSVERGARVAETGTLVPRSRASSQNLAPTTEAPDSVQVTTSGIKVDA
jgi:Uncharacterized conserved protein H4 (DUF2046)